MIEIAEKLLRAMDKLADNGRTSRLWLQYFNCITLVMQFIEAERLGNWQLHLQCVRDMLPLFHAAGHLAYAKSAQIYLQDMCALESIMDPIEYDSFTRLGNFTIRRSDKKWAGIWADMTIEQTLMRVMKVSGGLTHGRGINKESVVARWILGMPVAYEVMESFKDFCGVRAASTEQHTDWRPSIMKRDADDLKKIVEWFSEHDPFSPVDDVNKIMSIADGLCGGDDINCDTAIEIGLKSMTLMVGANATDVKMKRSNRVKSLAVAKRGIKIGDETVAVNTTLLFQRITAATKNDSQLATISLHYELAPYPLALFDNCGFMRKTAKSELLKSFTSESMDDFTFHQFQIVVDGGFLLHKVVWPLGHTYAEILQLYEDYIRKNYGTNVTVVFDGYKDTDIGIKSYERYRRSKNKIAAEVAFDANMTISLAQEKFLSNDKNKDRLIDLLKIHMIHAGIAVEQAREDADRLIVMTAIQQSEHHHKVAVVGQDVDLLVLLIALTPLERQIFFIKQGVGKVANAMYSTNAHNHLKDTILFLHAFTGCDTTSSLYLKGKKSFLKILNKNKKLEDHIMIFNSSSSSNEEIILSGERLMLAFYGAKEDKKNINDYRYERFVTSAARFMTEVRLSSLPPTASATKQHSLRVYFQVQRWLGNDQINPKDWGWVMKNQVYLPKMTEDPPAPERILKMIYCTCKGGCTTRCGCRKAGLKCSSICTGCQGNSCTNTIEIDIGEDSVSASNEVDKLFEGIDLIFSDQLEDPTESTDDTPGEHFDEPIPTTSSDYPGAFAEDDSETEVQTPRPKRRCLK